MAHIDRRGSNSNPCHNLGYSEINTEPACSALRICQDVQHMIDINTEHLERLRTPMAVTSELTKQEVRTLEGKLIKHFSKQLATRASLSPSQVASVPDILKYPSLPQWLIVVGITRDSAEVIKSRVISLDSLKDKTDSELNRLLLQAPRLSSLQRQEDLRRLSKALQNLRKYTDSSVHGAFRAGVQDATKLELHWDSWDHGVSADSPSNSTPPLNVTGSGRIIAPRTDSTSASSPSSTGSAPPPSPSPGITLSPPSWPTVPKATPPPTPPWSSVFVKQANKFPATPPPNKKHSTGIQPTITNPKTDYPLTKSKSHESELGNRLHPISTGSSTSTTTSTSTVVTPVDPVPPRAYLEDGSEKDHKHLQTLAFRRTRNPNEPICSVEDDITGPSPIPSPKSPPGLVDPPLVQQPTVDSQGPLIPSTLQVPKSPRTPRSMGHLIRHRFTKTFKPARCDMCQEYMFNGLKCKECKFKCHRDCETHVPPSCGLPEDLVKYYMNHLHREGSPIMPPRFPNTGGYVGGGSINSYGMNSDHSFSFGRLGTNPSLHIPAYPDSSSNTSSCNSSTPSSPAVMVTSGGPTPPHSASIYQSARTKFPFPDPPVCLQVESKTTMQLPIQPHYQQTASKVTSPNPIIDSVKSYDSDKTLSGSSGSAGTAYRLDSQDSVDDSSNSWLAARQTSISLREWDIPYEELNIGDKIGSGRFSTVFQGNWHGDVAIKILDMETMEEEATLEAFRLDVATFRKTRHENLILFMGACMNPPKLAIVTSLCKGNTLYTHLHLRRDKFSMSKLIVIAQQICQGMGYLHHRGIIHKDLKTKNIFLENGRAIITDFGLVNVARRLCVEEKLTPFHGSNPENYRETMSIPKGWLCYLAPEIMRSLTVYQSEGDDLPFTKASDIFAFGTVWFEMLTGEWPWKTIGPESIIWLVGRGMKPSLANLQASRDVKDILVMCWTYNADHRPDFTHLSKMLEKIPKKRLARSPSHPVHLSRSAESVF